MVTPLPGESSVLVIYDIEDDRVRNRIADRCKDFGLERVQYSAFHGSLSRNKREELWMRLLKELGKETGKIWVQPICRRDESDGYRIDTNQPDAIARQ